MKNLEIKKVEEIVDYCKSLPESSARDYMFTNLLMNHIFDIQGNMIVDIISEYVARKDRIQKEEVIQKDLSIDHAIFMLDMKRVNHTNIASCLHFLNGIKKPYCGKALLLFDKVKKLYLSDKKEFNERWIQSYNLTELVREFEKDELREG